LLLLRAGGYLRIVGELRKLGISVSATLVRKALAAAGPPPAPQRARLSWRSFLRQQVDGVAPRDGGRSFFRGRTPTRYNGSMIKL
jgi:hypothetical protein